MLGSVPTAERIFLWASAGYWAHFHVFDLTLLSLFEEHGVYAGGVGVSRLLKLVKKYYHHDAVLLFLASNAL